MSTQQLIMVKVELLLALYMCLTCGVLSPVRSARILGVFPFFAKSHHRVFNPLMATLARAGHEVVVYSPFPLENPPTNYTSVYLENMSTESQEITKFFLDITELPSYKCLDVMWILNEKFYQEFMEDKEAKKLLSSGQKFDLVLSETFTTMQEYTVILGQIFHAPVIGVQSFFANNIVNSQAGNSLSIAHMPDSCYALSDRMSFVERLLNSFSILRGLFIYYFIEIPRLERKMRRTFPYMPPLLEMTRVSLTFVNDHLTADYAQPRTPNIIPVAGIHIVPQQPLPQGIKQFMDEATEGVVLFSLGTYVPDELQPKEYFDMFISVFKKLRQRVLWKTRKADIEGLPENVMTVEWMPQQDVLAHRNCVLFITHGGLLSQHEAIHFGVPVVGVPQFFDQHRNVRFYVERGVGVKLDPQGLSEATISAAVRTVLDDPRYRENMRRLSAVFRDQPMTPAQTVVYWAEYVMRHDGAAHLTPASAHLAGYQRVLLDVLAATLAVAATAAIALFLLTKSILRAIRARPAQVIEFNKKIN